MSQQLKIHCPRCGSPPLRSLSIKHSAWLLDCSTDFIDDHIKRGTIDTITLRSPDPSATRKLVRIPIDELVKLMEERTGMNSMVEDTIKDW